MVNWLVYCMDGIGREEVVNINRESLVVDWHWRVDGESAVLGQFLVD